MKSNVSFKIKIERNWFQNKDILEIGNFNYAQFKVIKTPSKLSLFFKQFFKIITFGLYKPNYYYWVTSCDKELSNNVIKRKTQFPNDPIFKVPMTTKQSFNITGGTD